MPIHTDFYEKSTDYALSAIEIYNKPNFKRRSEVFSVLFINAWEALLKGQILEQNGNNLESLYVRKPDGSFKTTRNGTPLSLELIGCANLLGLNDSILNNLRCLTEIRDAAIHFVNDESIDYIVFALGTASLKNYYKIAKEWIGDSIKEYNFYIFPFAFSHNFRTINLLEVDDEPEFIKDILKDVTECQLAPAENGYYFSCEIDISLKSAKSITSSHGIEVAVNQTAPAAATIVRDRDIVNSYPLTATELYKNVKERLPEVRRNDFFKFLKEAGIKDNIRYSAYLFRNKRQKDKYDNDGTIPNGLSSLYNHECLRFIIHQLENNSPNNAPPSTGPDFYRS